MQQGVKINNETLLEWGPRNALQNIVVLTPEVVCDPNKNATIAVR